MRSLKRSSSAELEAWLESNAVKKLPPGIARGATLDGSVCSGTFSASSLSRASADASRNELRVRGFKEKKFKQRVVRRKLRAKGKGFKFEKATEKQKAFMKSLRIAFDEGVSKRRAYNMIAQVVRVEKELAREVRKRVGEEER